jgi:hypothetical protein
MSSSIPSGNFHTDDDDDGGGGGVGVGVGEPLLRSAMV